MIFKTNYAVKLKTFCRNVASASERTGAAQQTVS